MQISAQNSVVGWHVEGTDAYIPAHNSVAHLYWPDSQHETHGTLHDLLLVLDLDQPERIQHPTGSVAHNTPKTKQCSTKTCTQIKYNHSKNVSAVPSTANFLIVSVLNVFG
jgi:hypothetical protein